MEWLHSMPAINASLNALSGIWLAWGYFFIRQKRIRQHRFCMLAACTTSTLFLACYLFYHYHAGSTRFAGTGLSRPIYFSILLSHTILAVGIVPLAIYSVVTGLRRRDEKHRRVSRWTFPIWMYVSITGVIVYLMLYQIYPSR